MLDVIRLAVGEEFQSAVGRCRRKGGRTFVAYEDRAGLQAGILCLETQEAIVYRVPDIRAGVAFHGFDTRDGRESIAAHLSHGKGHSPFRESSCDLCLAESVLDS